MGIYDRDYYRQTGPGLRLAAPRSAVTVLILVNAAVYIAEILAKNYFGDSRLANFLSAHVSSLTDPRYWWQFLTCGFTHDPGSIGHIFGNMLVLWFLGRDVEEWYGTREFVRTYLVLLVFGSVVWAGVNYFNPNVSRDAPLLGASGAVTGVVILYALNFPRRMLLFMFVLPMPAWVLGIVVVLYDIWGAMGRGEPNVAYAVHLAGAALAFVYYQQRWNFGRLLGGGLRWPRFLGRPRLRVHKHEDPSTVPEEEVDRILEKIHREGESHLTRKERRVLEDASRQYQRRRQG
ncbi:MAG: rhomboid family intramembrane serine protease [Thermoguttaceae bacterium]